MKKDSVILANRESKSANSIKEILLPGLIDGQFFPLMEPNCLMCILTVMTLSWIMIFMNLNRWKRLRIRQMILRD
jgi:hypothetical protein